MHNVQVVHMTGQQHSHWKAKRWLTCVHNNGAFLDSCTCWWNINMWAHICDMRWVTSVFLCFLRSVRSPCTTSAFPTVYICPEPDWQWLSLCNCSEWKLCIICTIWHMFVLFLVLFWFSGMIWRKLSCILRQEFYNLVCSFPDIISWGLYWLSYHNHVQEWWTWKIC